VLTQGWASGFHHVDLLATASKPRDTMEQYAIGTEYWYRGMLAFRAGYRINHDTLSWSGGAGINVSKGTLALRVDYAYLDMDTLGGNHQVSLAAAF